MSFTSVVKIHQIFPLPTAGSVHDIPHNARLLLILPVNFLYLSLFKTGF